MPRLINNNKCQVKPRIVPGSGIIADFDRLVADGDTINVIALNNTYFPTRMVGIDTPEVKHNNKPITEVKNILQNPFDSIFHDSEAFKEALGHDLIENHLKNILKEDTAENHQKHADAAKEELQRLIQSDMNFNFTFFMAFSHEILDGYGRFLSWISEFKESPPYPFSYNEQLLKTGFAAPYFIWPNISPFLRQPSPMQAVPCKEDFESTIGNDRKLSDARQFVKTAREDKKGIFRENDPLLLLPFELRYILGRKTGKLKNNPFECVNETTVVEGNGEFPKESTPLHRYVIDLSKSDDPVLLIPSNYYKIKNLEDRLFIPDHFVPLFKIRGYDVEGL